MSYIGTEPKDIRSFGRTKFDYTASQGQTAFTGADDDGKVLAFTTGQIEVYVNGILMDDSDFTTTGTGTVTLVSAANLNDVVNIVSFESNIPDNDYVPASGGTFTGNITASGTLGVTGAVTASNGLTVDDDGATPLTVDRATSNGTLVDFQKDGSSVGSIATASELSFNTTTGYTSLKVNSEGDGLQYSNVGTRHFGPWLSKDNAVDLGRSNGRFKDLYLGGGAYLGGTGASNHLDSYEEGTCTITLSSTGTAPTFSTGGTFTATYVKIGRTVTVHGYTGTVVISSAGTGICKVVGLPFTITSGTYSMAHFTHGTLFGASQHGYIETPTNFFYPIVTNSINGVNYSTGTFYMMFTATYVCT